MELSGRGILNLAQRRLATATAKEHRCWRGSPHLNGCKADPNVTPSLLPLAPILSWERRASGPASPVGFARVGFLFSYFVGKLGARTFPLSEKIIAATQSSHNARENPRLSTGSRKNQNPHVGKRYVGRPADGLSILRTIRRDRLDCRDWQ
jgi:hypothetical protein